MASYHHDLTNELRLLALFRNLLGLCNAAPSARLFCLTLLVVTASAARDGQIWSLQMTSIPAARRFARGDRLAIQAQRIWLILSGWAALMKRTITYGELANLMGHADKRAGHVLARQLGIVGRYCTVNDLPPLNAIVVNGTTKMPGHDVVLRAGRTAKQEIQAVLKEDWFSIRVPTTGTFRQIWDSNF
jgi:hypothetical protein